MTKGAYKHHIHVDTTGPLPEEIAEKLIKAGFARSSINTSCLVEACENPNAGQVYGMYEGNSPETWTFLTNDTKVFAATYTLAKKLCLEEGAGLPLYVEGEFIPLDARLDSLVGKPLNMETLDRWAPIATDSNAENTYRDMAGNIRQSPFRVALRSLNDNETQPEMESHISIRLDKCHPELIAFLENGIGLTAYAVMKPERTAEGDVMLGEDGKPKIYEDRPYTIRFASGNKSFRPGDFLRLLDNIITAITEIGGMETAGDNRKPNISVKLERIPNFDHNLPKERLPHVVAGVAYSPDKSALKHRPITGFAKDLQKGVFGERKR